MKTLKKHLSLLPFLGLLLALSGAMAGCGSAGAGGSENRSPMPTATIPVRGVASVRVSAVAGRTASIEPSSPVANALVSFTPEGETRPFAYTKTDSQGKFSFLIVKGVRGRINLVNDRRLLSAIVVTTSQSAGIVDRDVNLESTVVEIALRNLNTLSYDYEAMEEQVRIGEAPDLLAEVKAAYLGNRTPAPEEGMILQGVIKLVSGEASATLDCLDGAEWCLTFSIPDSTTTTGEYKTKLLLRRDRTDGTNSETSAATVGAGHLTIRLPEGFTIGSLTPSTFDNNTIYLSKGAAESGNTYQLSLLFEGGAGISEATKIADITITGNRTLQEDERLIVTDQRLLGVLNENRGGGAKASL